METVSSDSLLFLALASCRWLALFSIFLWLMLSTVLNLLSPIRVFQISSEIFVVLDVPGSQALVSV